MQIRVHLSEAARDLDLAAIEINAILAKDSYKIEEVAAIRKRLLNIVRHGLDPLLPHMPDVRHY